MENFIFCAVDIIASFTCYTAHVINASNGCDIVTHKPCLSCFELQNINMI